MCVYVCTRGHLKGAQVWLGLLKSFGRNTKGCMVGNDSIEVYRVGESIEMDMEMVKVNTFL